MIRAMYDDDGYLLLGGLRAWDLVKRFKTPLYVLEEERFSCNCQVYKQAFQHKGLEVKIFYAGKALLNLTLCCLLQREKIGLEVVSAGEIHIALKAGFSPHHILFNGNNKGEEELQLAIKNRIHRIIVDNLEELELLNALGEREQLEVSILLRVNPGIVAHTHHYLETGKEDSKFGLGISDGTVLDVIKRIHQMHYLKLRGLHCHIGSQITSLEPYQKSVKVLIDCMAMIHQQTKERPMELNMGGGLGLKREKWDEFVMAYATCLTQEIKRSCAEKGLPLPLLMIEPGRSLINTPVTTLYQVGSVKKSGKRCYVIVDGGMTDNIRPALYQATYEALPGRKDHPHGKKEKVTIVGRSCESSDVLIEDTLLPPLKRGDLLAIPGTGAYTCSMASNYNGFTRPGMVMLKGGEAYLIMRRESWEDLLLRDMIPQFLRA